MIPGIGGGLTNSGSMPISAAGGAAGPSTAKGQNDIGGIKNGAINFGGGSSSWMPWIAVAAITIVWVMKK